MFVNLTQYQIDQFNFIRRNSRYRGVSLPVFLGIVLADWLDGGLYFSGDKPFSD